MNTVLLTAVAAGLLGMIGWGCADFFAKKTIDEIGDLVTLFWGQVLGLIPLLFLLVLWHPSFPAFRSWDPLALLAFGAVDGLSYIPLYRGFERGKVSILSPVFASYAGATVLISAFLFGEVIPGPRWAPLTIIFIGILLTNIDLRDLRQSWRARNHLAGFPEVLSAMIIFSFWVAIWGHYVDNKNWVIYVLIMRACSALTLLAYAGIRRLPLTVKNAKFWWPLAAIGAFDVLAYGAVTWGFSATSLTSIVALLSGAFSVPTVILARIFLKERLTRTQALAVATIIVGVTTIALV